MLLALKWYYNPVSDRTPLVISDYAQTTEWILTKYSIEIEI